MKQHIYITRLLFIFLAFHSVFAEQQSINKIILTNKTDHIIKNIKVKFTFIGKNDAAEQNHTWGKIWIKNLEPNKAVIVDPRDARHPGVIGKVYEHFDNPRIALQRIDAGKAHQGFGKPGTFRGGAYVIFDRDGTEKIRSYGYYKNYTSKAERRYNRY
jgi:hypothetical protein